MIAERRWQPALHADRSLAAYVRPEAGDLGEAVPAVEGDRGVLLVTGFEPHDLDALIPGESEQLLENRVGDPGSTVGGSDEEAFELSRIALQLETADADQLTPNLDSHEADRGAFELLDRVAEGLIGRVTAERQLRGQLVK